MIQKHTLDNGLRVITESIPSVRSVSIGVWVGTGSKYETRTTNGISHFIEHMMFKGTTRRTARQIAEAFDRIGGNVNAFTSKEYTCYYARVLDQHVEIALDVLADMFFHSLFDAAELEKEKNVIIEEIRMYEDTPDELVHDLIAAAAFPGHALGFPILGSEDNLRAFTRDDVLLYIEDHYHVENTVITVAGNIDDTVLKRIEKHFGAFSRHSERKAPPPPAFEAGMAVRVKETEQAHLCLALPGLPLDDPDIYSLILLNNVLGGSMSSRLFQEVREERGLAYSVYSYHSGYRDGGLFTIYVGTAPRQVDQVVDLVTNILRNVKERGITDAELENGKEQLKGSLVLSLESTNSRMSRLGKNELLHGRHYTIDEILARIEAVNQETVRRVAQRVLSHPLALAMVSPLDAPPATYRRDALV